MKTRTRRRRSTRSADHDEMVCATASAMKPSAIRLVVMTDSRAAIHRQLTKLNAATAAQITPCHQRKRNSSSNNARVNSQNTTTLPLDSAISGACQAVTSDDAPIE